MRREGATLRQVLLALATVLVIAAAAVLWHSLPTNTQIWAPFDVHGSAGSTVTGRGIAATVHRARIAPKVRRSGSYGRSIAAAGQWVVVDATIQAVQETVMPTAELVVAGNTYRPELRFHPNTLGGAVDPGIPESGVWVFDVATDYLDTNASVPFVLRVWTGGDERLDSRLVIVFGKQDVSRQGLVTFEPPELGT